MCDLIREVITYSEAAIRVKSTHRIKSCFENYRKIKYGNKTNFYTNINLKDRVDILQRANARGSADVTYRI